MCSFYPNRLINAIEGAMLICPNGETAERVRQLCRYGIDSATFRDTDGEISPSSDIPEVGWAASLSQLHAAVGLATATTAASRLLRVGQIAEKLHKACRDVKAFRPIQPVLGSQPAYWVFLLLAENRNELKLHLASAGIHTTQLHQRNDVYSGFHAAKRDLPGTSRLQREVLALPCGWWLTDNDLLRLTEALASAPR